MSNVKYVSNVKPTMLESDNLTPTILSSEDLNMEVLEAIERCQIHIRDNQAQNPDAKFDVALYDRDTIDHDFLDGHIVFRSYGPTTGAHVYDLDREDILGHTAEAPFSGYLVAERHSFKYDADGSNVYELIQDNGNVLYTSDINEIEYVLENLNDYNFSGFAFRAGEGEVNRLWNAGTGRHLITGDDNEVEFLTESGEWVLEGTL